MKKFVAIMLAAFMCVSFAEIAFADDSTDGFNYSAFQSVDWLKYEYDDMEDIYTISPIDTSTKAPQDGADLYAYIGGNTNIVLFAFCVRAYPVKNEYIGLKSVIIKTDSSRYTYDVDASKYTTGLGTCELGMLVTTKPVLSMLEDMLSSKSLKFRLKGEKFDVNFVPTEEDLATLRTMLDMYLENGGDNVIDLYGKALEDDVVITVS